MTTTERDSMDAAVSDVDRKHGETIATVEGTRDFRGIGGTAGRLGLGKLRLRERRAIGKSFPK